MINIDVNIAKELSQFYLPFLRFTGMVLYLPVFSSNLIPVRIRIIFSIIITFFVYSIVDFPEVDVLTARGFFLGLTQFAIGFIFAFLLQMAFQAASVAGEVISMTMGLAFAQIVDPSNGHSVPLLSQLFLIFITLYFLALDAHLLIVQAFALSFYHMPVDSVLNIAILLGLAKSSSIIFSFALLVAMPIITTLLSINIAMGIMSRSAPQLNVFNVGFPMALFLGYVSIMIFIGEIISTFSSLLNIQIELFVKESKSMVL